MFAITNFESPKSLKIINWSLKKKIGTKLSIDLQNRVLQNLEDKNRFTALSLIKTPLYRLGFTWPKPKSSRV